VPNKEAECQGNVLNAHEVDCILYMCDLANIVMFGSLSWLPLEYLRR
jgi:hypothetical protein